MSRKTWILSVLFVGVFGCDAAQGEVADLEFRGFMLPGDDCKVGLWDSFNEFSTILTVKPGEGGDLSFIVDDNFGLGEVTADFASRDSPLVSDASVPDQSLNEIRERFEDETATFDEFGVVQIGSQLTYFILPKARCTEDEFALIHFFVEEWFYFG